VRPGINRESQHIRQEMRGLLLLRIDIRSQYLITLATKSVSAGENCHFKCQSNLGLDTVYVDIIDQSTVINS